MDLQDFVGEVTRLPMGSAAALRVLDVLEAPGAGAGDLSRVIETDPALALKVIRLANTPYFGQSQRVPTVQRAVTVLGTGLVRAIALSAAFGLLKSQDARMPPGFWRSSLATAAASGVLAPRVGIPPYEAVSTGLVLDVGAAVLFRMEPQRYASAHRRGAHDEVPLLRAEDEAFGFTHAELGARILGRLRFPDQMVQAVAEHHLVPTRSSPAPTRVAYGAMVLACGLHRHEPPIAVMTSEALAEAGFDPTQTDDLLVRTRRAIDALSGFVGALGATA